jgi:diguanylate cyclase (GGDEF)-like protein
MNVPSKRAEDKRRRRILLIEDSAVQREAVKKRLTHVGYRVMTASDSREGLRLLGKERPDLILLDVVMPEVDGWRTLELIRTVSAVPVIMLTVRDSELARVKGLHLGADDYIGKPFGELELAARIEAVLRRSNEARSDPLTGLPNYRAFHEKLDSLLLKSNEYGRQLSLVLFDLDDFKRLNDRAGHPEGDRALRDVARITLGKLRIGEEAFRIGGEEFAIIVEGDRGAGVQVADRVRRAIIEQDRRPELPTMSAGVAAVPEDASTKDVLVRKADVAMYAAKNRGKNQVVAHREGLTVDQ